jgi:hypothetical protein
VRRGGHRRKDHEPAEPPGRAFYRGRAPRNRPTAQDALSVRAAREVMGQAAHESVVRQIPGAVHERPSSGRW